MKKVRIVFMGMLFVVSIANSVSRISVRMEGLGSGLIGIVSDEYSDIFYNPAYLSKMEGMKLYTALSGISTIPSYPFGLPANFYALVGGVGDIGGFKLMGIHEQEGLGFKYTYEYSDVRRYEDTTRTERAGEEVYSGGIDARSEVIGIATRGFGAILAWETAGAYFKTARYSESHDFDADGKEEYKSEDRDSLTFEGSISAPSISAGYCAELGKGDLSVGLGISPVKFKFETLYLSDFFNAWPLLKQESWNFDRDLVNLEASALLFSGNARMRNYGEQWDISYLGGLNFYYVPLDFKWEGKDIDKDSTYGSIADTIPATVDYTYTEFTETTNGNAMIFRFGLGAAGVRNFEFTGRKSLSAIGAKLSILIGSLNLDTDPRTEKTVYRDIIYDDSTSNDDGYITNYTSGTTVKTEGSLFALLLDIPVGVETQVTDNLTLRLGSNTTLPVVLTGSWDVTETKGKNVKKTEYTHGPNAGKDTTIYTNVQEDKYEDKYGVSIKPAALTTFSYGASYKVNDAIEFDLTGFANLTSLTGWKIAVNIKY